MRHVVGKPRKKQTRLSQNEINNLFENNLNNPLIQSTTRSNNGFDQKEGNTGRNNNSNNLFENNLNNLLIPNTPQSNNGFDTPYVPQALKIQGLGEQLPNKNNTNENSWVMVNSKIGETHPDYPHKQGHWNKLKSVKQKMSKKLKGLKKGARSKLKSVKKKFRRSKSHKKEQNKKGSHERPSQQIVMDIYKNKILFNKLGELYLTLDPDNKHNMPNSLITEEAQKNITNIKDAAKKLTQKQITLHQQLSRLYPTYEINPKNIWELGILIE